MRLDILDPDDTKRLLRRRRLTGADRFDEVWDGVYVMSPIADNEHQQIAGSLTVALALASADHENAMVLPGTNVSDRQTRWKKNYRCPDVAVFLPGNPAVDRKTYWLGGPDLAVEVASPYDRSREKNDFYAKVGTRELLIVDHRPWSVELYQLHVAALHLQGQSSLSDPRLLKSDVLPLTFRLVPGASRPRIEVVHVTNGQTWLV